MKKRRQLNFRESLEYQKSILMGQEGLFLSKIVSVEYLPENIYFYYMQKERRGGFHSFSKRNERRSTGMFFSKQEIEMNSTVHYLTEETDFEVFEEFVTADEFFEFFQVKLSLDKQISLADEKRFTLPETEEADGEGNFIFKGKQGQY